MQTEVTSFSSHGQENDPLIEYGILENNLVCAQFSSKLAHGTLYALSRNYLEFL